jgi:hypothetical protein
MTVSIKGLLVTFRINDIQQKNTLDPLQLVSQFVHCYAECHCAEFRNLFIVMLNVIALNVVVLGVVVLNVVAPAKVRVPCKAFQPSLIFEGRARSLPNELTQLGFVLTR